MNNFIVLVSHFNEKIERNSKFNWPKKLRENRTILNQVLCKSQIGL